MSSGPEHYVAAEILLAGCGFADAEPSGHDVNPVVTPIWLAAAKVHATLALAAATALANTGEMYMPDCEAWERAASVDAPASLAAMDADHAEADDG